MVNANLSTPMSERLNEVYDRHAGAEPTTETPWPPLRLLADYRRQLLIELAGDRRSCEFGDELSLDQMYALARNLGHAALAVLEGQR